MAVKHPLGPLDFHGSAGESDHGHRHVQVADTAGAGTFHHGQVVFVFKSYDFCFRHKHQRTDDRKIDLSRAVFGGKQ